MQNWHKIFVLRQTVSASTSKDDQFIVAQNISSLAFSQNHTTPSLNTIFSVI